MGIRRAAVPTRFRFRLLSPILVFISLAMGVGGGGGVGAVGLGISGVEGDPMHIVITPYQIAVVRTHLEGGAPHLPGPHVSRWPDLPYQV